MLKRIFLFLLAVSLLGTGSVEASSARRMAMGGAGSAAASGPTAALSNPALLALRDRRTSGVELIGFDARLANNAFSLNDYNTYTGATLNDADKEYLLGRIPQEGLDVTAEVRASALSFGFGSAALTFSGHAGADVTLSRDLFELFLYGNAFGDTISLSGTHVEGISYAAAGFSTAFPLYYHGNRELTVGITASYLRGIAVEEIISLNGMATTDTFGFAGAGSVALRTATGGSGWAVSVGGAYKLNQSHALSLTVENFLGGISWSGDPTEYGYEFAFDTLTADNAEDDQIVSNDYDSSIASFSTALPRTMVLGLADVDGVFRWAVDWRQGLNGRFSAVTQPQVGAGVEWRGLGILPLRVGYSLGGRQGSRFTYGLGLHLLGFYLDVAAASGASFDGYESKGTTVAIASGLQF